MTVNTQVAPVKRDARRMRRAAVAALVALFFVNAAAFQSVFTSANPGANDFYSRWESARAVFLDGMDLYSDEVLLRVQQGLHGRPALPGSGEDIGAFTYPYFTIFFMWPLTGLPYSWAQAAWMTALEFLIVGLAVMSASLARWRLRPLEAAGMIVFSILFYHSARAIILGQFAVIVAVAVIGSILALRSGRDWLAGALLPIATIKPQMVFLIIPYLLLWAMARRRWRVVWGFLASAAVLFGVSFILSPNWLVDFVRQIGNYTSYTFIGSPVWVIVQYYLGLGDIGELIVSGAILLALLAVWARTIRDPDWGTFQWVCGLTLIVGNLIALRTATTNYPILYPALWLLGKSIIDHAPRWGKWIVAAGAVALVAGIWLLFAVTVAGREEHALMYLPLPWGLALAFVLWRRQLIETARKAA